VRPGFLKNQAFSTVQFTDAQFIQKYYSPADGRKFIYKNLLSHPVSIIQQFMLEFIIPIKKLTTEFFKLIFMRGNDSIS
jgi:hypothetical protein